MKKNILTLMSGALLMLAAPSCSKDDGTALEAPVEQAADSEQPAEHINEPAATVWHVTLNAKTASNGISKALSGDYESGFQGKFAKDEEVYAFKILEDGYEEVGELTAESDGETTTFTGEWTGSVSEGDELELRYLSPNFDYNGQDGTLENACKHFYATAKVKVTAVDADANTVSLEDATFEFCSSMVKFTLTEKAVTSFSINDGKHVIKLAFAAAAKEFYVSLPPSDVKTDYTIMASDETVNTSVIKTYNLEKNKYYTANVTFFKALKGEFTVNGEGKTVCFASGNLRYNADVSAWSFAPTQLSRIGNASGNASETAGTRDLFGWGMWLEGQDPMESDDEDNSMYLPSVGDGEEFSNNSAIGSDWKTLSAEEWKYLIEDRDYASDKYGLAEVDGVQGLILLPDDWTLPTGLSFNSGVADYSSGEVNYKDVNNYSAADWQRMENSGAVFLPAAGNRTGASVLYVGVSGYYWSSSAGGSDYACNLGYYSGEMFASHNGIRYYGFSVRLVRSLN